LKAGGGGEAVPEGGKGLLLFEKEGVRRWRPQKKIWEARGAEAGMEER